MSSQDQVLRLERINSFKDIFQTILNSPLYMIYKQCINSFKDIFQTTRYNVDPVVPVGRINSFKDIFQTIPFQEIYQQHS